MKQIFADTSYWVAYLKENDQWSAAAEAALKEIGNSEIVTTESVLIEVLNYFSEYRAEVKRFIAASVESLLVDESVSFYFTITKIFSKHSNSINRVWTKVTA